MTVTLPKEKQTAYERWEMSSFDDPNGVSRPNRRVRQDDQEANERLSKLSEEVTKEAYGKGYTKGMQDGFAVGMEKGREHVEKERLALANLVQNFNLALDQADDQVAGDLLSLALDVAQAMMKAKMALEPESVLPVIKDAIHYLPHIEKPARIIVHPADAVILRKHLSEELASDGWVVQEEDTLERGGCMVETGANKIDASNEVRWKRISESFSKNVAWHQS